MIVCGLCRRFSSRISTATFVSVWAVGLSFGSATGMFAADFNRDIRPLLADRCFACHGPDAGQRQADLRLDLEADTIRDRGDYQVIVPGDPSASEMIRRMTATDPGERMPPADLGKTLSEHEVALIKEWISQGATWQKHWSLIAPVRPQLPNLAGESWPRTAIDDFVFERLRREGLEPSPPADPRTLIRRLAFDLTGLPPTPETVAAFTSRSDPAAYETFVDRLLDSPHYGERMAIYWLDLVRFADTNGIHGDNHRDIALYRDYVINAFNDNFPFDRFTQEQLAGDLLPQPTRDQLIGSGYNRLLMTTREGGAQPKEYRAKYAADRVRNASSVWLGLTLGCAECHDHKFDPLTQNDFYSFAAFFADIQETAVGRQQPTPLPSSWEQSRVARIAAQIESLQEEMNTQTPELDVAMEAWETYVRSGAVDWRPLSPAQLKSTNGHELTTFDDGTAIVASGSSEKDSYELVYQGDFSDLTALRLEALEAPALAGDATDVDTAAAFVVTEIRATLNGQQLQWSRATATAGVDENAAAAAIDSKRDTGWTVEADAANRAIAVFEISELLGAAADEAAGGASNDDTDELVVTVVQDQAGRLLRRFRISGTAAARPVLAPGASADGLPDGLDKILEAPKAQRSEEDQRKLAALFRTLTPLLRSVRDKIARLEADRTTIEAAMPRSLVSMSGEPRVTRVLPRGNWLDESGTPVKPDVPSALPSLQTGADRATRMDLANWLVAPENPLVARVFVNRLWKLLFGQGLVATSDDFGSQGSWPSHPDLLDWLATDFISSGWDIKHTVKLIVMSATYRQSSLASPALQERDPFNYLLARQGRFRLDAEMVRDNALAVSGLLSRRIGGPSARPYQPAGYWAHLNFPKRVYEKDTGENLYRRGLYTYWARTFLHPSLLAFDAPSREECTVDRPRSNTPQQALVLLNDPTYVESARFLAERVLREVGDGADRDTFKRGIEIAYRLVLQRAPLNREIDVLFPIFSEHLSAYESDPNAAAELLSVGDRAADARLDAVQLAAWTSATRVLLNLHESITRN